MICFHANKDLAVDAPSRRNAIAQPIPINLIDTMTSYDMARPAVFKHSEEVPWINYLNVIAAKKIYQVDISADADGYDFKNYSLPSDLRSATIKALIAGGVLLKTFYASAAVPSKLGVTKQRSRSYILKSDNTMIRTGFKEQHVSSIVKPISGNMTREANSAIFVAPPVTGDHVDYANMGFSQGGPGTTEGLYPITEMCFEVLHLVSSTATNGVIDKLPLSGFDTNLDQYVISLSELEGVLARSVSMISQGLEGGALLTTGNTLIFVDPSISMWPDAAGQPVSGKLVTVIDFDYNEGFTCIDTYLKTVKAFTDKGIDKGSQTLVALVNSKEPILKAVGDIITSELYLSTTKVSDKANLNLDADFNKNVANKVQSTTNPLSPSKDVIGFINGGPIILTNSQLASILQLFDKVQTPLTSLTSVQLSTIQGLNSGVAIETVASLNVTKIVLTTLPDSEIIKLGATIQQHLTDVNTVKDFMVTTKVIDLNQIMVSIKDVGGTVVIKDVIFGLTITDILLAIKWHLSITNAVSPTIHKYKNKFGLPVAGTVIGVSSGYLMDGSKPKNEGGKDESV